MKTVMTRLMMVAVVMSSLGASAAFAKSHDTLTNPEYDMNNAYRKAKPDCEFLNSGGSFADNSSQKIEYKTAEAGSAAGSGSSSSRGSRRTQ